MPEKTIASWSTYRPLLYRFISREWSNFAGNVSYLETIQENSSNATRAHLFILQAFLLALLLPLLQLGVGKNTRSTKRGDESWEHYYWSFWYYYWSARYRHGRIVPDGVIILAAAWVLCSSFSLSCYWWEDSQYKWERGRVSGHKILTTSIWSLH